MLVLATTATLVVAAPNDKAAKFAEWEKRSKAVDAKACAKDVPEDTIRQLDLCEPLAKMVVSKRESGLCMGSGVNTRPLYSLSLSLPHPLMLRLLRGREAGRMRRLLVPGSRIQDPT